MSQITLDPDTLQKLMRFDTPVSVLDQGGKVVGRFIPAIPTETLEPRISQEELDLRIRKESGQGRRLKEIMSDIAAE